MQEKIWATRYEPFPYEGSSTSGSSEGGFAKIAPSFFIFFSPGLFGLFFSRGGGGGLVFFFLWVCVGGGGVVVLPGWLHMPLQGY